MTRFYMGHNFCNIFNFQTFLVNRPRNLVANKLRIFQIDFKNIFPIISKQKSLRFILQSLKESNEI